MSFTLNPIGVVCSGEDGFSLELDAKYAPALKGLEGFSHVVVLYWLDGCDAPEMRSALVCPSPYIGGPDELGVFATRAPFRPNPIAITTAGIVHVDHDAAKVYLGYIDANDMSPLIDIKPYTPSVDRVENPATPDWCAKWPKSVEQSGEFDWGTVFGGDE